ncbi:LysR family transcriptional regulator [Pseudoduganella namucuonensis]|uniref:Transcriptional regulator, LysR family n=1 Tax=Pseudoduganella namucuonensis TaxID=1035707 RepID=A0A1I7KND0_9BURK|nr:LysR family transcriptional regulator [Pseudoduganella namucuonensis]SFU98942.1 transcriptional regulator, LysR family [Pseudoduganella namucuonensis]
MPRQFDYLGDVEAFLAIMDHGTISAAAVALGTTPSVLSRAVARLETRLGAQLMRRTTRRISITEAGQAYLEQARDAFRLLAGAERAAQGQGGELTGTVRISAPTTYAHYRLPGLLRPFMDRHPRVVIELSIANRNVDLVSEGYDMAIRLGELKDSGLAARKLEDAPLCLVAAPSYLARAGAPRAIADLAGHACLPFVMPSTGKLAPWLLREDGGDVDWVPPARLRVTDDVLGVVSLAQQGLGICQTYEFIAAERLARGELVAVLPANSGRVRAFSLIYPPHRGLPAACRALIDAIAHETHGPAA